MSVPLRLVADYLRRTPATIIVVPLAFIVWTPFVAGRATTGPAAISLSIVGLTSVIAMVSFLSRPLQYLPVSRRQIWQAQWLLCTCVATLMTTTGKLFVLLLPVGAALRNGQPSPLLVSLEPLMMSALCDFAYGGSFPAAIWLMRLATRKTGSRFVAKGTFLLMSLWFAGCFVWGWVWQEYLPLHVADLAGLPGAGLAAALSLAVAARWHTPPLKARQAASRQAGPQRVQAGRLNGRRPLVTGVPLLVLREVLLSAGVVVAAFVLLGMVRYVWLYRPAHVLLGELSLALAPGRHAFLAGVIPLPAALVVTLMLVRNGMQPLVRQLRAMPLSASSLNMLYLFTPMLSLVVIGVLVAALRVALTGQVEIRSDLEVLVASAGIAALTQSIQLRRRESWSMAGIGAVLVTVLLAVAIQWSPLTAPLATPLVFGVANIVIAAVLNHRWLTRSAMTYRPTGLQLVLSD